MGIRSRVARGALATALLASTVGATLALTASPASAAAPVVDLWAPATINLTQQDGEQAARTNHIYAMAIIRHDAGTNVNGVRFDLVHSASGGTYGSTNCSTTGSATCSGGYVGNGNWSNGGTNANVTMTVRELPGQASATTNTNSNYSQVWLDIKPRNGNSWQNDGPDGGNNGICGLESGGPRLCKNTASFSFRLSDNQTTGDQTMTYWTVGENDGSGEDFPAVYATTSTDHTAVTAGAAGAVTIGYTCDDNDGGGGNDCDSAKVRFRRLGDNALVNPGASSDASGVLTCANATSGPGCETRTNNNNYVLGNFNADDNVARSYTFRAPRSRGLYVIEGLYCNDDGLCPHGNVPATSPAFNDSATFYGQAGTMWQTLGSFYVNDASPTVAFGTTTQTGGSTVNVHPTTGALHPNTGTTMTFNATTSGDVQVIDWNTDQNNSNGINSSGYESRTYGTMSYSGSPGTPTVVKTRDQSVSGYAAGANCAAAVRVYDTGGINATDITSASASATRTCTTNNLPTATAQSGINLQRGTSANINLAAGDADRWSAGSNGGDEAPTINVTQPAVGTVTCGSFTPSSTTAGTFACSYSVPANATPGAYSYSYTVTDSHAGTSSSATVTGTIQNTAPTATGGSRTIQRGTSSTFNLNGTDPVNGDTIDGSIANTGYATASTAGMPSGSTTNCTSAGACTVAIAAGTAPGASSFTWNVKDNNATSSNATESVTITNTAPVASPVTKNNVQRGRPADESTFQLVGTDAVNNDPLTYSVVSTSGLPAGSTLDCTSSGACEVAVPADTALGNYSFTYKANDNNLDSNTATATIGVGNTTPVANPVGVLHTTVGAPLSAVLDGTDFNGDTLTYDAPVATPTKGSVTGTGADRTYTAANGTKGADSFTYTVSDNAPSTSTAGTVSIQIDNTAPVADAQSVSAVRQVEESFQLTGSDVNADALTYAVSATTSKGTLSCDASGACTYTADIGATGTDSFTFVSNDGTANSADATVTITITNSDPTGDDQAVDAPREVATAIQLTGTDPNGDDLTFSGPTTGPSKGEVTCDASGSCSYTSDPGETGTDSFTFTVTDIEGATDTATVTVTLTNSAPSATAQSVDAEREVATPIVLTGTDPNNDDLTFEVVDQPTKGIVSCNPDGSCTYTSGSGQTGTDSFTFTADDGNGGTSTTGTVSITLTNTAPVATSATYNVTKGIPKSFVLDGTDLNNDSLTFSVETLPSNGTLGCTANVCTYTASITTGSDSFTFSAHDAFGGSSTGTVNFLVGPPRITLADSQVLEPELGQTGLGVMVPVTLSSPVNSPITLSYYTEDGSATGSATGDYGIWGTPAKPRTQVIPAGSTFAVISPIVRADSISEPVEDFEIHLVSATTGDGSPVALGDAVAHVDIIDNYNNTGDPIFVVNDTWIYESDNSAGQKGQITLQLSKASPLPVTVNLVVTNGTAVGGNAGNGNDYKKGSVTKITFAPGQTIKTWDFQIWGDTVVEDHETFTVQAIPTVDSAPVVQQKMIGTAVVLNDD